MFLSILASADKSGITDSCRYVLEHLYETFNKPESELLNTESLWWVAGVIAILIILYFLTSICKQIRITGFLVFIAGWILYWIGYASEGTGESISALALRSMMASLEMFIGRSNLIEVHKYYHEQAWYMTLFSLVHFLALSVSITVVFRALFKRIWYKAKLFCLSYYAIFHKTKDLYVFFGVNDNSEILVKDIRNKKKEASIIFVGLNRKKEEELEEETSFWKLMGAFTSSSSEVERVWNLNVQSNYTHCKTNFKELEEEFTEKKEKQHNEKLAILKALGLKNLRRWMLNSKNVKIFFLSEDREYNLLSLDALVTDKYFRTEPMDGSRVIVYCHARRENTTLLREQQYFALPNMEVHIIDSSYLSVWALKQDPKNLPIEFVDIDNGQVTSSFNAMVVGFGETGQEALQFIYEFGTFDAGESESKLHCIIVDDNMEKVKAPFLVKRPALKDILNPNTPTQHLDFWDCSVHSQAFWKKLEEHICQLNYVVIAMGDDELNTSFAMDLYEFAIRHRENNLERFKIYVRAYTPSNETRLSYVAKYLNNSNKEDKIINIFGLSNDIFSYDSISVHNEEEEIMKKIKLYYNNYCKVSGEKDSWAERRKKKQNIGEKPYDFNKVYKDLLFRNREIMRMESQDFANYFHIPTKLKLLGLPNDVRWNNLSLDNQIKVHKIYSAILSCIDNKMENKEGYPDKLWELITSVSKTEHYRWNNAHKIMGYEFKDEKDKKEKGLRDVRMTHKCITDWSKLDNWTQSFDAMVVATTLMVQYPEIIDKKL